MEKLAILYRPELKEYDFGPGHPFRGDRYEVFPKFLKENLPEDNNYRILTAEPAIEEDLLLICKKEYIDFTRAYFEAANAGLALPASFSRYHSMDNHPIGRPGKLEQAARLIIGQAKMACEQVQEGKFEKAVAIGGGMHHAKYSSGEGFCLYNDVAFCGTYLLKKYNLERVLILDTDAHCGNGTMEYFYSEDRVLFIDLHQDPMTLYPGVGFSYETGAGKGKGFTVNIPMPPFAGYDAYKLAFESIVEPITREFNPQIIIRNGGTDPHFADGLTNLGLPVKGFRMIGDKVRELAKICGGREIDLIGSGYNAQVLPYGWMALISGIAGIDLEMKEPVPGHTPDNSVLNETESVIQEVKNQLKDYWSCFR